MTYPSLVTHLSAVLWEECRVGSAYCGETGNTGLQRLFRGVGTHQYWRILDSRVTHYCTMIDDNQNTRAHTHLMTMMTRWYTTLKVLFFVFIFGRKWIEKSIWQPIPLHLRVFIPEFLKFIFTFFDSFCHLRKIYCALSLRNVSLFTKMNIFHPQHTSSIQ
uniref:(northern house mosquito) hypothetical protein n=1 Tax=Culex pipiens TaxID=7175 RepID=A0A8D8BAQ0_CULPI